MSFNNVKVFYQHEESHPELLVNLAGTFPGFKVMFIEQLN